MRMVYNPKHLGDKLQAWRCFLTGSLVTSSFVFFAITDNVIVFVATLAVMIAGVWLFIDTNVNPKKTVYVLQNIFSAGIGLVVSLAFYLAGLLLIYLWIIIVLVFVTWMHKYRTGGKTKGEEKEPKKEK